MRLLLLTSHWSARPGDPRGARVRDLAQALAEQGFRVEVAAARQAGDGIDEDPDVPPDVAVRFLPALVHAPAPRTGPGRAAFAGTGALLALPPFLVAFAAEAGVRAAFADVLVAVGLFPMGAIGSLLARVGRRPLVLVTGDLPAAAARFPVATGGRRLVAGTVLVACPTPAVRDAVARLAGSAADRVVLLPPGARLRPHAPPPGRDAGLRVAYAGELLRCGGADVLLRAAARVPGTSVALLGDGPDRPSLVDLADRLRLQVAFGGPAADLAGTLAAHDVRVLPARRGASASDLAADMAETWACGVPVVVSDLGGAGRTVASSGGGLAVPAGDVGALAGALGRLAGDEGLRARMRVAALESARQASWDVRGPAWAERIRAVAGRT